MNLAELTLERASALLRSGRISPVALTQAYLERIEEFDGALNAFITVTADMALKRARALESELSCGRWRGPLHGIPVALKDNIDTAGVPTTGASELFASRIPQEDAEVVRRLDAAGAIMLGKLNLHEFGLGGTSAATHYGPVHNPWNLDYVPGGSSGGSAAAVAARLCAAALGTDTVASVRMPASFCGIVGLKATYGLVSTRGLVPLSRTLDHCGPLTRSVADSALMLQAMAGFDPRDPTSIRTEIPSYASALYATTTDLRIGIPRQPFFARLDPEVESLVETALDRIATITASMQDVTFPDLEGFAITGAEAYAWHAPYLRDESNHALYQPETLGRILSGAGTSAVEYQRIRRRIEGSRRLAWDLFEEVDLLITPTTPVLPGTIENALTHLPVEVPAPPAHNTMPFNILGLPTISVPCGLSSTGFPAGLQISGPQLGELDVLRLAHAYEQGTDWHRLRPPVG